MIAVCDMGPLHYLVLIDADHILPRLFTRVLAPPAVLAEMSRPETPEPVRRWAFSPPEWLEVKEPAQIEDIPSLGKKGTRGAGEKAAIALACEARADAILMDDKTGRREAKKRGLPLIWMLEALEEAADRGLITDLAQILVDDWTTDRPGARRSDRLRIETHHLRRSARGRAPSCLGIPRRIDPREPAKKPGGALYRAEDGEAVRRRRAGIPGRGSPLPLLVPCPPARGSLLRTRPVPPRAVPGAKVWPT